MTNFTSLQDLYEFLESDKSIIGDWNDIIPLFQNLRDEAKEKGLFEESQKAQWEIDFLSFRLNEGEIKCRWSGTTEDGEMVEYPSFLNFDESPYEYLLNRFKSTSNPLLKSRYAHILWKSPKKHFNYASKAIEEYLKLIHIFESKDAEQTEKHFGQVVLECIKAAYYIAINIRKNNEVKIDEVKVEIIRLVENYDKTSKFYFAFERSLIELIINDKKIFTKEDISILKQKCLELAEKLIDQNNFHFAIQFFELGDRISLKTETQTTCWRKKIAECYEKMMAKSLDEGNYHVATSFCVDAIENYKKAKDELKVKELSEIYSQVKEKGELIEISNKIDIKDHIQKCRDLADYLTEMEPETLIGFLVSDNEYLLPSSQVVMERAEEIQKTSLVRNILPIKTIDKNCNPSQTLSSDEEIKKFSFIEQYRLELQIGNEHLIREIIFSAILKRKISTSEIINFLIKHSWLGINYKKKYPNNKVIEYNWINLIVPGLDNYFQQLDLYLLNSKNMPNFVLSTDSLILKIEGILRDFCRYNTVSTSIPKRNGTMMEKTIDELLREDVIKEKFTEDEINFFKFVLVEKMGYNLRHNIAHSLMIYPEYNFNLATYVVIILLRLSKYSIEFENSEPNQSNS